MLERIGEVLERIKKIDKPIKVVSHFDSDGVTSATIFSRVLCKLGKRFSLAIVKNLDKEYVEKLEEEVLIFLDLASGSLDYLGGGKEIYVFDHHEIPKVSRTLDSRESSGHEISREIPSNVLMVNPALGGEMMSSSGVCYLFAKHAGMGNKELANLAIIGMMGDLFGKEIGGKFSEIIKDSEGIVKRGLLVYPSTRPLDRALEYSSSPYIPGVSGNREGILNLLKEVGVGSEKGKFKALYQLSEEEMGKLVRGVMLKGSGNEESIVGNLFLIKFLNNLEDARELSALINAASKMDRPEVALGFCLGNKEMKEEAEKIYIDYKQNLFNALKYVDKVDKIEGEEYIIINTQDKIKDSIIGTVASILSHSPLYPEGRIIVTLGYNEDKIKASARIVGRKGRNVREVLSNVVVPLGGEVGGHPEAAGCLISREKEAEFIGELQRTLDIGITKV